ncbi:hypothetical protein M3Y98_01002400 [Aphelenchoides besseyi]|nr:hypothetical protein M3Y98_01002400 [Aphelenchoides besseyi]KAI6195167.1 hypothetical protein M3Y96_01202200 [Aphelenchoides besseyi]
MSPYSLAKLYFVLAVIAILLSFAFAAPFHQHRHRFNRLPFTRNYGMASKQRKSLEKRKEHSNDPIEVHKVKLIEKNVRPSNFFNSNIVRPNRSTEDCESAWVSLYRIKTTDKKVLPGYKDVMKKILFRIH